MNTATNAVIEITKVATVNSAAEVLESNPRYCEMYVGSQNTTVVRTTPVMPRVRQGRPETSEAGSQQRHGRETSDWG